jgi:hypothetical protein
MVREFVYNNGLRIGDVIIAKLKNARVLDHYIVYMGYHNGQHYFIANFVGKGVQYYIETQVEEMFLRFEPVFIRKFNRSEWERSQVVGKGNDLIGRDYSWLDSNCEHLANYLQYGVCESPQANKARQIGREVGVIGLVAVGLIALFAGRKQR